VAEVDGGSVSVIARQMAEIRDEFIAETFEEMKAEIQGLSHDARMMDLWMASRTGAVAAGITYLDREMRIDEHECQTLGRLIDSLQRRFPFRPQGVGGG
jgi:hypothetical protein